MTYQVVYPIWEATRGRFQKKVEEAPEQGLNQQLGKSTIGGLIHHTAEVEYMFAEWFFGKAKSEEIGKPCPTSHQELVAMLTASNEYLLEAMRGLSDEEWHQSVESPMGTSTPLEAVGRLMYHTGIHAGQISLIQQNGKVE